MRVSDAPTAPPRSNNIQPSSHMPTSAPHRRTPRAFLWAVSVITAGGSLAGCVGGDAVTPCAVSPISLTVPLTTLTVGQTTQADAAYSVQNCSPNPTLTFTSDSTRVATVSATGLITAVAAGGPVNIRATVANQTRSVTVTVVAASVGQRATSDR